MPISNRTGWVVLAVVLIGGLAASGYFVISFFSFVKLPSELKRFDNADSAWTALTVPQRTPPDSARLDTRLVKIYIASLDSATAGFDASARAHHAFNDRFERRHIEIGDVQSTGATEFQRIPRQRRALIEFLNGNDLSREEYVWLKIRVLAAAGISATVADSAIEAWWVSSYGPDAMRGEGMKYAPDDDGFDELFQRVDAIHESIDSAEILLVQPYRARLLDHAVPTLHEALPYL
jgi:hypothetical protein